MMCESIQSQWGLTVHKRMDEFVERFFSSLSLFSRLKYVLFSMIIELSNIIKEEKRILDTIFLSFLLEIKKNEVKSVLAHHTDTLKEPFTGRKVLYENFEIHSFSHNLHRWTNRTRSSFAMIFFFHSNTWNKCNLHICSCKVTDFLLFNQWSTDVLESTNDHTYTHRRKACKRNARELFDTQSDVCSIIYISMCMF